MVIVGSACLVVADGAEGEVVARVLGGRHREAVVERHDEGLLEPVEVVDVEAEHLREVVRR